MDNNKCIVAFGEVMLRLGPEKFFRLQQSLPGRLEASFGGGEANVCAALALLGENSRYVTALPDNPISAAFAAQMRGIGADVEHIRYSRSGRLGIYFVETGANQRPSNVIYDREHSVLAETEPDQYDYAALLADAKWLHLTGITPALSRKAFLSTLEFARQAAARNIFISCDLNFRKKLWNWDNALSPRQLAGKCMTEIIRYADLLIGNEEDADDVFGIKSPGSQVEKGIIDVLSYKNVARKLSEQSAKVKYSAITFRESISASHNNWGGMLYEVAADAAFYAPLDKAGNYSPYEIHQIVDRVGGGDAFAAGLIYALCDRDLSDPQTAIGFAVAAGCLKHSVKYDFNYAARDEVLALLKGNASGRVNR